MSKDKISRYLEVATLENVTDLSHLRPGDEIELRGRWSQTIFGNEAPVILELACGKGDYAIEMARRFPDKNFIGVDIKGERIWKGAKVALAENLTNVHFVRAQVEYLSQIFGRNEISEIWITFPDPFLKYRRRTRRLTHPRFIDRYRNVLKEGGLVHLKTDSPELFRFTLEVIQELELTLHERIDDIYALGTVPELLQIRTFYEQKHLREGRVIRFLVFEV